MNTRTLHIVPTLALALAVLSGAALATFTTPADGSTINITKGGTSKIHIFGVNKCTFNATAMVTNSNIVSISPQSASGQLTQDFVLTANAPGLTDVTIFTSGGTCPAATHSYTVLVSAGGIALTDFKNDIKIENSTIKNNTATAFNNATPVINEFLDAAKSGTGGGIATNDLGNGLITLRNAIIQANLDSANNVQEEGTTILNDCLLDASNVSSSFFDAWHTFENGVPSAAPLTKFTAIQKKVLAAALKTKNDAVPAFLFNPVTNTFPVSQQYDPYAFAQAEFPEELLTIVHTTCVNGLFNNNSSNGGIFLGGIGNPNQSLDLKLFSLSGSSPSFVTLVNTTVTNNTWQGSFLGLPAGPFEVQVFQHNANIASDSVSLFVPGPVSQQPKFKAPSVSSILSDANKSFTSGEGTFINFVFAHVNQFKSGAMTYEGATGATAADYSSFVQSMNGFRYAKLTEANGVFEQALPPGTTNSTFPISLMPGSGGPFDTFNTAVNTSLNKTFVKAAKDIQSEFKGSGLFIDVFNETQLPNIGNTIPVIAGDNAGGNAKSTEVTNTVAVPPKNALGNNGTIVVMGFSPGTGVSLTVTLEKSEVGQPAVSVPIPVIVVNCFFVAVFPNLKPGDYQIKVTGPGVQGEVGAIVFVDKK
ncbi:MAG: hypothetical protein HY286_05020 [Planctomycetes bacterium]|nr:hypothetical protein [Planctomycetota bacterium]